jgi:hypothetical protein
MAQLTQLPDVVDLSFVSGDTFRIRVRVINPTSQQPETLATYGIAAWIAKEDGHTNVSDFEVTRDADGVSVILTLSPKETSYIFEMRPNGSDEFKGKWDLEVTFPPVEPALTGDVRTVAKGSVTVVDDITHAGGVLDIPEPP